MLSELEPRIQFRLVSRAEHVRKMAEAASMIVVKLHSGL